MKKEAAKLSSAEIHLGLTAEFSRHVSQRDIDLFASVSGDHNPLHTDACYASTTQFGHPIAHGVFQAGLASAMAGMHLPGKYALLAGMNAKFLSPLPVPSDVMVKGEVTAWNPRQNSGQLRVDVLKLPDGEPASEFRIPFTLHEADADALQKDVETAHRAQELVNRGTQGIRQVILVTGASGGIGSAVARALIDDFDVLATFYRTELPEELSSLPSVTPLRVDFSDDRFSPLLAEALSGRALYGIVHCAWPGLPKGGLLEADTERLRRQIDFGSVHAIRLGRELFESCDPEIGGRLVLMGSTAGRQHPSISFGTYSLGKDILESSVRLLAPELARRKVTVNAIAPSLVATGMNGQTASRIVEREAASVPIGRVCTVDDISNAAKFLLSSGSCFVSGQVISLTGGRI